MTTFAEKARRLDRARLHLKRRYGDAPKLMLTHPVEHVLRAILSEEATASQVDQAVRRLREQFVDWNDLRVSRPREIREALGPDFPGVGHKARVIPRLLDQVFKHHNSMVWDFMEAMGKVATRAFFASLEEVRPFVAATIARDCAGAHAFPVDHDIARALGRLGILDPEAASETQMQAFLERAVKSPRAYETHYLVKRLAEDLCLPETPVCSPCPLSRKCPSAVLEPRRRLAGRKHPAQAKKRPQTKKKRAARKPIASRRRREK
jgi:endonuclease III